MCEVTRRRVRSRGLGLERASLGACRGPAFVDSMFAPPFHAHLTMLGCPFVDSHHGIHRVLLHGCQHQQAYNTGSHLQDRFSRHPQSTSMRQLTSSGLI